MHRTRSSGTGPVCRLAGASLVAGAVLGAPAAGQSLFLQPAEVPVRANGEPDPQAELRGVSMFYFAPPEPRRLARHDIVTIIIDETSRQTSSQSLETEKDIRSNQRLRGIVDPLQLLQLRLEAADVNNLTLLDGQVKNEWSGEGDYDRTDRFSARVTAEVLEVKPNGTLVLQASKRIIKDDEVQTLVLSGVARQEDITDRNTVLSSQLANLNIVLEHEGELRNAARKGFLTRVFETIFNF